MTAATALPADAVLIAGARQVYGRARDDLEWPEEGGKAVAEALWDLGEALERYRLILAGDVHATSEFPQLTGHPEAHAEALLMAAEDAVADAGELVRVIAEACGTEAAAFVSGQDGGT